MKVKSFEEIISWQLAQDLTIELYRILKTCKDFEYRSQILRAVVSISCNIAEGFEKDTDRDFIHYLYIAKGSVGEVRSLLYIGERLGYLSSSERAQLHGTCVRISMLLSAFIKSLNPSVRRST